MTPPLADGLIEGARIEPGFAVGNGNSGTRLRRSAFATGDRGVEAGDCLGFCPRS